MVLRFQLRNFRSGISEDSHSRLSVSLCASFKIAMACVARGTLCSLSIAMASLGMVIKAALKSSGFVMCPKLALVLIFGRGIRSVNPLTGLASRL
jgi:hypothetical protein